MIANILINMLGLGWAGPVLKVWGYVKRFLNIGLSIRVWMILLAVLAHFYTKGTAVRAAVEDSVQELLASEKLAAEREAREAAEKIAEFRQRQLTRSYAIQDAQKEALLMFERELREQSAARQELEEDLDEILAAEGDSRTASDNLVDRMRDLERGN